MRAKFRESSGPTIPIPGPMFPKVAATAPSEDSKSNPIADMTKIPATNMMMKTMKKDKILETTS